MKKIMFFLVIVAIFSAIIPQKSDAQFSDFGFGIKIDNSFPTGNEYTPNLNMGFGKFYLMNWGGDFGFTAEVGFINDNTVANKEERLRAMGSLGFTFRLINTKLFEMRTDVLGGMQTGTELFEGREVNKFIGSVKIASKYKFSKAAFLQFNTKAKFNKRLVLLDIETKVFLGKPKSVQVGLGGKYFKYNSNPGTFGPVASIGKSFGNFVIDIIGGMSWGITGQKTTSAYFGIGLYYAPPKIKRK